jgi:hypothetical protein
LASNLRMHKAVLRCSACVFDFAYRQINLSLNHLQVRLYLVWFAIGQNVNNQCTRKIYIVREYLRHRVVMRAGILIIKT